MRRRDMMVYQDYLLEYARSQGPFDPLTRFAQHPIIQTVLNFLSIPIILVQIVSTFVLGILHTLTFGLALLPLYALWFLFLGGVVGSSWLWIKVPVMRPILLVPGILWATVSKWFAACMPEMGEWESRATKQAVCESWPHSYHIMRMPKEAEDL